MKERLDNRKRLDEQLDRAISDSNIHTSRLNATIEEMLRLKGIKHL